MHSTVKQIFDRHFEWAALAIGVMLLALMNPYAEAASWCLFEWVGIGFCPGEGLGHSISFIFRGEINKAIEANAIGFLALPVILGRIGFLITKNFQQFNIVSKHN